MGRKEVELLAPAGSMESLKAAIQSGADAVYLGGSMFGARAYATNFDEVQLKEAIDYVHIHGKKLFLTVNTLLKNQEIEEQLYQYLNPLYIHGLDAVLVQDLGVLQFIRKHFPLLPIHTSTQMTLNNKNSARFYKELGVERVVVSRELSLGEIGDIVKETGLEVESFVHGALCYCYSGQCLYSSMIGGRSGNRGQCAQPCRLQYQPTDSGKKEYLMSLKDICTLEFIPDMIEHGIYSFKIEGRMKRPEYVACVTGMYRKYVDLYLDKGKKEYQIDPDDVRKLMDIYNRGGFTGGYYAQHNSADMVCKDRPNHAGVLAVRILGIKGRYATCKALVDLHRGDVLEFPNNSGNYTLGEDVKRGDELTLSLGKNHILRPKMEIYRTKNQYLLEEIQNILAQKKQEKIKGILRLTVGECATLTLTYGDQSICVSGPEVQEAKNQPLDSSRVKKQMNKTGNDEFHFQQLDILIEGNVFYPMQHLNELRHSGMEQLTKVICESYRREQGICHSDSHASEIKDKMEHDSLWAVSVDQLCQVQPVMDAAFVSRVYLDANLVSEAWKSNELHRIVNGFHQSGKKVYFAMPHVFRQKSMDLYDKNYSVWLENHFDGVLVRNVESFSFLKEHQYQKEVILDHHMYIFNSYSKEFWLSQKVEELTASLELNYNELRQIGMSNSEIMVYGYIPMMLSANCIRRTTKGCTHQTGYMRLKDRVNKEFSVKNCCDYCYNITYNSSCLSLLDQREELEELRPQSMRLSFTLEDEIQTKKVLDAFEQRFLRLYDEKKDFEMPDAEYTRGHFKRGIK